jgi:oxygen-independent coproporphyrinogen-3 oxidase
MAIPLTPTPVPALLPEWRAGHARPRHLYLHIPFCHRRCAYCDFNTYANMEHRIEAYVDALCHELHTLEPMPPATLPAAQAGAGLMAATLRPTVFLGGGTPSMLPLALLERVLRAANALVPLEGAEVTIEANPGTVLGRDYLRGLLDLGVNRISMGVQSLDDPTLRVLGRIHTAQEAYASFEDARAAGFRNINLDFIFGLPGQTVGQWEQTLATIGAWGADHFSLYSLILEERTPLYAQVTSGRVQIPDDDATGAMYELAMQQLAAAGYQQYEISNWARRDVRPIAPDVPEIPALACHHNLAYWLNVDYLGCGAGAHGHLYPRRYVDTLAIDGYITRALAGTPIAEITELTTQDLAAETMFMGLRVVTGVGYAHFKARVGAALDDVYGDVLDELEREGLVIRVPGAVRLTERGRLFGNRVFERFV